MSYTFLNMENMLLLHRFLYLSNVIDDIINPDSLVSVNEKPMQLVAKNYSVILYYDKNTFIERQSDKNFSEFLT